MGVGRKPYEDIPGSRPRSRRPLDILVIVFLAAVVLMLALNSRGKNISCEMDAERIGIAYGSEKRTFVAYDEITDAALLETFDLGEAVSRIDWDRGWAGVYENDEWGSYDIYAYSEPGEYIVIHYKGGTVVFNGPGRKSTEKTYEKLLGMI